MIILAIDTATEACSVALNVEGKVYCRFEVCPQQQSQLILPMIEDVLNEAKLDINEVNFLAYGRGPGSFTGVRIATGILQGLALGTGVKVVGVSTMAAMAQQIAIEEDATEIAVAIDARMQEVYYAQYQRVDNTVALVGEELVLPPVNAAELLNNVTCLKAGTGWEAYPELQALIQPQNSIKVLYPNARYILPLAEQMVVNGQAKDIEQEQPVYLRDKVTWKKLPGRE